MPEAAEEENRWRHGVCALVHSTNEGLIARNPEIREPRGAEVRVRVKACGVCRSDLHLIDGDWPFSMPEVIDAFEDMRNSRGGRAVVTFD